MRNTHTPRALKARHGFCELLTPDGYNPKTKKGRARGYSTAIMHFSPARKGFDPKTGELSNTGAQNNCADASPGCIFSCLDTAGHGGIIPAGATTNDVQLARASRKAMFFDPLRRAEFNDVLVQSVATHVRRAGRHELEPTVRPNGTSDLPWERLKMNDGRTILETYPDVQFYDYTKNLVRALANAHGQHPANYHLTFSRSETNEDDCRKVLAAGGNVAVVFAGSLPATYLGAPVINGDADDLRFLDPAGVVVGLTAKGRGKRDASGFVVRVNA
jgi:hypothetical protein